MKAIVRLFFTLGVVVLSLSQSSAQLTKYQYEAGINIGTLLYQGDLVESPMGSFKGAKPMVNLWLAKPFTPYFSWRANLTIGSLSADESRFATPAWKQFRNFSFKTPVTEFSGMLVFNPYGDNGKDSYHTLTPYIMAGAGLSFLNVQRDWSDIDSTVINYKSMIQAGITQDSLHTLPGILPVIPIGAGVKWMVTPTIAVNAEATMRFSFSDYIDGFSYSANPKHKDAYYGILLGVSFILGGSGLKCPTVGR